MSEENNEELNLISLQRVCSLRSFDEKSAWLRFKQSTAGITDDEHNFISITGAEECGVYIGLSFVQWQRMKVIATKKYARYATPPPPPTSIKCTTTDMGGNSSLKPTPISGICYSSYTYQ
jgi:hypothetical protein